MDIWQNPVQSQAKDLMVLLFNLNWILVQRFSKFLLIDLILRSCPWLCVDGSGLSHTIAETILISFIKKSYFFTDVIKDKLLRTFSV